MKKIILIFILAIVVSSSYGQEGAIAEDIAKFFSHSEPHPIPIPTFPIRTIPIGEETGGILKSAKRNPFESGTTVIKDGILIDADEALRMGLISNKEGTVKVLSSKVKTVDLNRPELEAYRSHLGLSTDGFSLTTANDVYDQLLVDAVKVFQKRKHFSETGVISGQTEISLKKELYTEELIRQTYLKKNYTTSGKRDAIVAFQAVNQLDVTGVMDVKTSLLLDRYIFKDPRYGLYSTAYDPTEFNGGTFSSLSFADFNTKTRINALGLGKKDPTNAELALQLIKLQKNYKLPATGHIDENTGKLLNEFEEIDGIIPSTYKKSGKKFGEYQNKYLTDIQVENKLKVTGKLDDETRLALRPTLDKNKIKVLETHPAIHQDFVSLGLVNSTSFKDIEFYFNDEESDYFIVNNNNSQISKSIGYQFNRQTGAINHIEINDVLSGFDKKVIQNARELALSCTIVHLGIFGEDGKMSLQIGASSIEITTQQLNEFVQTKVPIPGLAEAMKAAEGKPIFVFRPEYKIAGGNTTEKYTDLYGSGYSTFNTVKFTAGLGEQFKKNDIFLVSDIKNALKKTTVAVNDDINPQFRIYTPNKAYFDPKNGWRLDDYHIVNNLRARNIYKGRIVNVPAVAIPKDANQWTAGTGPKMFIGHKNDDFKKFLASYVKNPDQSPLFLVSCYARGDESFVSKLIYQTKVSNVIYFSEVIHPTAITDVIAEFDRINGSANSAGKSFKELWYQAIDTARKNNEMRYTDTMKAELDKLYKVIFMLTLYKNKPNHTRDFLS
jgi:hypothetical protein